MIFIENVKLLLIQRNLKIKNRMKKIFGNFLMVVFIAVAGSVQSVSAQQFHSKPTALLNLTEEARYTNHILREELAKDSPEYKAASEKLRFINKMLFAVRQGMSVEDAATKVLPAEELNNMQIGVKYFDAGFADTTPNRYIRKELLSLIAY